MALVTSGAALPGLSPFGPWELALVTVLFLFFLGGFFTRQARFSGRDRSNYFLKVGAIVYIICFVQTAFLGLAVGNHWVEVLRSVAPYIGIVIVVAPWWWRGAVLTNNTLNNNLLIVGVGQAIFTFFLFLTNTASFDSSTMLASRVTQFDARLTMPFIIAAAVIAFLRAAFSSTLSLRQIAYLGLAAFCVAASLVTQTRSQILSIAVGALIAYICAAFVHQRAGRKGANKARRRVIWIIFISAMLAVLLLIFTDFGSVLLSTILLRNSTVGDGRVDYEVIPVLELWAASGPAAWLFGVGAGTPFIDGTYESRTYLHNLGLYALLYGGVVGLCVVLFLWWILGRKLNDLWRQENNPEWLALLAVVAAMFCYAQFFAVHKILSFNLILWLAITCVFSRVRWIEPAGRHRKPMAVGVVA